MAYGVNIEPLKIFDMLSLYVIFACILFLLIRTFVTAQAITEQNKRPNDRQSVIGLHTNRVAPFSVSNFTQT